MYYYIDTRKQSHHEEITKKAETKNNNIRLKMAERP